MPRAKREDYPGAWHHVMNRGVRRQKIFFQDQHCLKFLDILGKDSTPSWLSTQFMTGLFGGATALQTFVREVYTKAVEYPDDFNPETGLFKRKGIAKRIMRDNQKPELADPPNTSRF